MKKPCAMIFGISGQTGAYLAHLLLAKGYCVVGTSRDAEINSFSNLSRLGIRDRVTLRSVSLNDFRSVLALIQSVMPDEIYNLAGQSSVALSFEQPVEAFESIAQTTLNILECLRFLHGETRLFNATSTDCFGRCMGIANEDTAFRPRSPYAMAKAASFWSVASYRESYAIFAANGILSNHESPLRPNRFVTRKVVQAAGRIAVGSKEKLRLGDLTVERDWGWAPDYAQAMWQTLQHDAPSDFIIATGKTSSLQDIVAGVFGTYGLNWKDHVDIDPGLFRPSEIARVSVDPARIAEVLGWRATITMPSLASTLVEAERTGSLGHVPWQGQPLQDRTLP